MLKIPKKDKFQYGRSPWKNSKSNAGRERIDSDKKRPKYPRKVKVAFIAFANGVRTRILKEFKYGGLITDEGPRTTKKRLRLLCRAVLVRPAQLD